MIILSPELKSIIKIIICFLKFNAFSSGELKKIWHQLIHHKTAHSSLPSLLLDRPPLAFFLLSAGLDLGVDLLLVYLVVATQQKLTVILIL